MSTLRFSFDHVAESLHELEDEECSMENYPEDVLLFFRIMEAKTPEEIADIPAEKILDLMDKLPTLVPYLNLDNPFPAQRFQKTFMALRSNKRRIL